MTTENHTPEVDLSTFRRKIAERRAQEAKEKADQSVQHDSDLVPEATHNYERTESDIEIDDLLEKVNILDAYDRWCGKPRPKNRTGQREGVKISCPIPGHIDSNPSAWINLDKQTWFCGACEVGGDKYDIAAYWLGISDYKEGANFHKLRQAMAESLGYRVTKGLSGKVYVDIPEEEPQSDVQPEAQVIDINGDDEEEIVLPSFDWRPVCPEGTFLYEYMKAASQDDAPEEYHFFHALLALGFVLGRKVGLMDGPPVYANLYICTLGRSGIGKSRAQSHLNKVLEDVLPYKNPHTGVRVISGVLSAEALVDSFVQVEVNPADPTAPPISIPARNLIEFGELSALINTSNRQNSTLEPKLIEFYDNRTKVTVVGRQHGVKTAEDPFASALTTTQPKSLRGLLTKAQEGSGFLNRWVYVTGTEKKRKSLGGFDIDLSNAIRELERIRGWVSGFRGNEFVVMPEDVWMGIWDPFFQSTIERDKKRSQRDLLTRIDLTLKKLMLLFAANRGEKEISKQSAEDAIYCYQYLKDTYGIPESQIGNTVSREIQEKILYQISKTDKKNNGRGATVSDVTKALKNSNYERAQIAKEIKVLYDVQAIELLPASQGPGRKAERYKVSNA